MSVVYWAKRGCTGLDCAGPTLGQRTLVGDQGLDDTRSHEPPATEIRKTTLIPSRSIRTPGSGTAIVSAVMRPDEHDTTSTVPRVRAGTHCEWSNTPVV